MTVFRVLVCSLVIAMPWNTAWSTELCVGATLRQTRAPEPREPRERGADRADVSDNVLFVDYDSTTPEREAMHQLAQGLVTVGCKYDYEAYVENGSCRARGGGHHPSARVTLKIHAPFHLAGHSITRTQYVQFDDSVRGYDLDCQKSCASATATLPDGRRLSVGMRCNVKSFE